ncbi:Transmembrane protein [Heracleum sosnowskyi]|uniref:Transmembrane protein n=1 Tax=Heracleum sosnowskyi TaxID=360622 RepID=A0AAD8MHU0_9APIA|nr:Transmembrane protein [Heracleum sosnowskyi]
MSQPFEVYPAVYPTPNTPTPPAAAHHSNGSFGTVFVVLAVIVLISAIACCLGRLCSKRRDHAKGKQSQATLHSKEKDAKKNNGSYGDLEFGFDKRLSSSKVAAHEDFRGPGPKPFPKGGGARGAGDIEFGFDKKIPSTKGAKNEEFRGPKAVHSGQPKKEVKFAKNSRLK